MARARSYCEILSTLATFASTLSNLRDHGAAFLRRHPRSIAAAVAALLAGFGATAFGIAPLMAEADSLPRRTVTEIVTAYDIETQLETLAQHELELHRSDLTRASDTADSLLRRLGVLDPEAASFLRTDAVARKLLEGRPGKMVQVRADESGSLEELIARSPAGRAELAATHFSRLRVLRIDGRLRASVETAPLAAQVRMGSGTVTSSLFAATDEARIPDRVASQLAEVFATEIDFHRELRKGDTFSVVYEALTADGEPIPWATAGRVLAAEFINGGKRHAAIWFAGAGSRGAYFGLDGKSKTGSFLASPMAFSRVTSGFAMRMHPIQRDWRQHKGIDYAAPMGTPVRSVGDGTVTFAGWQNGYGNVVAVQHGKERETLYAHLSRIGVRKGQQIAQGEAVGAVGMTGWSTGPHLHFEFKVDGRHRNPAEIARQAEDVALSPAEQAQFVALAASAQSQLAIAQSVVPALGE
jgi:murein DD-endopeptidase MepM/ murein hydrolase activator NlpD